MLSELRVANLGIIDELTLTLSDGLTAITGETGAGKTLIVEALDLLRGGRADPSLVRSGAAEARVDGRFVDGDTELVLARVVPAVGRSRAYINGRLATAVELGEVGRELLDLHGQHDHQSLLAATEQRAMLDAYLGETTAAAKRDLRSARAEVVAIDAQLSALGGDERTRAREIELLRFQIDEIEAAAIVDLEEDALLEAEEQMLAGAEAFKAALGAAHDQVDGPVLDGVGKAIAELLGREPLAGFEQRLRGLQAEASDLATELRVAREAMLADPQRLSEVGERRKRLRELRRKYGETLAEVVAFAAQARDRREELVGHEQRVAALTTQRERAMSAVRDAADRLSAQRREGSEPLANAVAEQLRSLALAKARFAVTIDASDIGDEGADLVTFELAANRGEPLKPLAKAASGGELSRVMLALRMVLSDAPPTLVFDEVDAGIGGATAVAVGHALASVGAHHQVLCVTHLAQVAAAANAQIDVTKIESAGRTVARAELLLGDARVNELSRMLAGVVESTSAREHARELLASGTPSRKAARR